MTGAERVKKYREQNPKKVELLQLRQNVNRQEKNKDPEKAAKIRETNKKRQAEYRARKDLRKIFHPLTYLMLHLQVRMKKQIKTMLVIQVILMEVSKHPKEKADNLVGITPLILLHLDILDNIFLG